MARALTQEQAGALARWRARHGRAWKARLRDVWLRAAPSSDDEGVLYALRNSHGPSWLNGMRPGDA